MTPWNFGGDCYNFCDWFVGLWFGTRDGLGGGGSNPYLVP